MLKQFAQKSLDRSVTFQSRAMVIPAAQRVEDPCLLTRRPTLPILRRLQFSGRVNPYFGGNTMAIPAKVAARITTQLKTYQGILAQAMKKDSSEGDTVVIVTDMIADILGYDKYQDLNSEHAIRGTYVDLMVSTDSKPRFLMRSTKSAGR
jgi:hypothetical protein